jgi:tetratricopeptide (TPR) repeat protein
MRYEVAPGLNDPSVFSAVVPGRPSGEDRNVFSYAMPVNELKPGQYYLRASLSSGPDLVKRVARAFRVEPAPAVPASTGSASAGRAVALSVRDEVLTRQFRREDVIRQDTLQGFRSTLSPAASRTFDEGLTALAEGDAARAEQRFRSVLEGGLAGTDNTAALAYLGATFAAAGRDLEAISIWQIALVDGSGFPQLYEWIGYALLRLRNVDEARPILEEAVGKWPGETRLAKPLAIVYAKSGRSREALALLERYLADHREDTEALQLGVEWLYQLHTAGVSLRSREEDLKVGQGWADAYTIAKGPQVEDVKRWMLAIETAPAPSPAGR